MKFLISILCSFSLLIVLSSCQKKYTCAQRTEMESSVIEDYLSNNGLKDKAIKTDEGLYYVISTAGAGAKPNINSQVTVNYKGYLTDGTVFDQANNVKFYLSDVVQGWQIGMQKFSAGSKGKLFIPSCYGYGETPPSGSKIPKNSVLIFDIDLLEVR